MSDVSSKDTSFENVQGQIEHVILFDKADEGGEEIFRQEDLIELFPYGLSLVTDSNRPTLIFKDKSKEYVLPVPLNPLEAGVAMGQSNKNLAPSSPHKFTQILLSSLDIKVLQCVFVEIKGVHQFVRLYLSGHSGTNSIKLRADEAMSLCLYLAVPIFASKKFVDRSKVMNAEIQGLAQSVKQNPRINILRRNQNFIQ